MPADSRSVDPRGSYWPTYGCRSILPSAVYRCDRPRSPSVATGGVRSCDHLILGPARMVAGCVLCLYWRKKRTATVSARIRWRFASEEPEGVLGMKNVCHTLTNRSRNLARRYSYIHRNKLISFNNATREAERAGGRSHSLRLAHRPRARANPSSRTNFTFRLSKEM